MDSPTTGTALAALLLVLFVSYKEVERYCVYAGSHGLRKHIFPHHRSLLTSIRAMVPNPSIPAVKQMHSVMSPQNSSMSVGSMGSGEHSDDSHPSKHSKHKKRSQSRELPPPVLVYHESARSIVFRDHLRRAAEAEDKKESDSIHHNKHTTSEREKEVSKELASEWHEMSNLFGGDLHDNSELSVEIQGFQPNIVPLPHLQLGPNDEFAPLIESEGKRNDWTPAEREVVQLLETQHAVVKTIKNTEWTSFLHRFKTPHPPRGHYPDDHNDIAPHDQYPFNSFVTSTTLLPPGGRKMRCYGNASIYTTGVVFALPQYASEEEESDVVEGTRTWSWPSGYSAKTEFNIDSRGSLINGRQEALVPLSTLRAYNLDYLDKTEYNCRPTLERRSHNCPVQ